MKITEIDLKYKSLADVLKMAYERAAIGKGHIHHSRGEAFEDQWICRGARTFGLGGLQFQIGKKNEQIVKMDEGEKQINELLDIINYAAAGVIVLKEEMT